MSVGTGMPSTVTPRISSEEVAEDYKNSLEDLALNSRYEISNLTIIAKENTEHAMAISRVLENHIRNTPPNRKLPALYVLDSIVKNVGTPYTLFLGRNLYNIFMNAYSLVNENVRRKLDEMLKTWKEPVPQSMDHRPVFSAETTRPIENALIKAKTAAVQQQEQQRTRAQQEMIARQRPMTAPNSQWHAAPTPPHTNGPYLPPPQPVFQHPGVVNNQYQPRPAYPPPNHFTPPQQVTLPYQQPYQTPLSYVQNMPGSQHHESLDRDIAELVNKTKAQLALNLYDQALNGRLQALLALQDLMRQQQLPPNQIQAVRDQITALSAPPSQTSVPLPYTPPPQTAHFQQLPQHQRPSQVEALPQPGLPVRAPSNSLADIIARAQQNPAAPPTSESSNPPPQIALTNQSATPSVPNDLLATLRANGLLSANNPPNTTTPSPYIASPTNTHTPSSHPPNLIRPAFNNDVELTSASLKILRPHLISRLYEAQPNQCTTCGRRFLATPEGKEKKAKHLDWHFRTNQRLADSAKRGLNRSWYVDELDWIKSRDGLEDTPLTNASTEETKAAFAASLAAADPKKKYIPVPSDQALANQPCPICQEKFDTTWNDDVQDFVWNDAIQVGARVYHASCHAEVKRDGGNTPGRTGTPDSVLGKRKAMSGGVSDITAHTQKAIKA